MYEYGLPPQKHDSSNHEDIPHIPNYCASSVGGHTEVCRKIRQMIFKRCHASTSIVTTLIVGKVRHDIIQCRCFEKSCSEPIDSFDMEEQAVAI